MRAWSNNGVERSRMKVGGAADVGARAAHAERSPHRRRVVVVGRTRYHVIE
jgi:hypothetical protein